MLFRNYTKGFAENKVYSSSLSATRYRNADSSGQWIWRAALLLPIYRKSSCVAEGEEKVRYPQELDDYGYMRIKALSPH